MLHLGTVYPESPRPVNGNREGLSSGPPGGSVESVESTLPQPEDGALLAALARGEPGACASLYDRYAGVLFTLCLRILGSRADAEEALGDVFLELWRHPERYDPRRGNLLGYLVTLTRSRAIDRLRARKKHASAETELSDLAGSDGTPLQETLFAERAAHIARALSELGPEQREAIELAFYSDLSHAEVASRLGQPLGTIKSRIRTGLIRLRDSLRTLHEDPSTP